MKISRELIHLIEEKYQEMVKNNLTEDFLDEKTFGEIKVFIDKKPKYCLLSLDRSSKKIFIGAEFIKKSPVQ